MSKNYYDIYINSVLDLASTVCIKSEESADKINQYLVLFYGDTYQGNPIDPYNNVMVANPDLPDTWKYYLNISGEYHFTDLLNLRDNYGYGIDSLGNVVPTENIDGIKVTSLDDLTTITFNKDNLSIHTTTAKAYRYGQRHYRELVAKYPDLEQLILGILYPADINKAISSDNAQIIAYPSYLVEENEVTLINKLNKWLSLYKIRWDNKQFTLSDSLYCAAQHAETYLVLVNKILALRLANCKTNEVHSFHIRQYLISHGISDNYLDYMTLKQMLFFYRNIGYIERNSGKRSTFKWLLEKIMTDRGLPISELSMRHNVSGMLTVTGDIKSLRPEPIFEAKSLNQLDSSDELVQYSLMNILTKEIPNAVDNQEYVDNNFNTINQCLTNSLSSVTATKLLESFIIDYSNASEYTLHDTLLNNWLYLSSCGYYPGFISFKEPRTNNEQTLSAINSYLYMVYCLAKYLGADVVTIPKLLVQRALRVRSATVTEPTLNEIKNIVDSKYLSDSDIQDILNLKPKVNKVITPGAFNDLGMNIFNYSNKQIDYVNGKHNYLSRTYAKNAVNRLYFDGMVDTGSTGLRFVDWLEANYIPVVDYSQAEYFALFQNIYNAATGADLNTIGSLSNIQKAMIGLFKQLSSYTIDFLSDINQGDLTIIDNNPSTLGDIDSKLSSDIFIQLALTDLLSDSVTFKHEFDQCTTNSEVKEIISISNKLFIDFDNRLDYSLDYSIYNHIDIHANWKDTDIIDPNDTDADKLDSPIVGIHNFNKLSSANKLVVKDIW
jgi:hypothetical protein